MQETEHSRRIDSSGRIIIPSQLRDALDIRPGDTHSFFIHEHEGAKYLCIKCFRAEDEIERAKRILREAGISIG